MVSFIALIRGGAKIITTTNWQELHSAVQEFLTVKQLACLDPVAYLGIYFILCYFNLL